MIEHFLADQNLPFSVSLVLMLLIAAIEGVGVLLGLGLSDLIDSLLPDFDIPDADVDAEVSAGVGPEFPQADGATSLADPGSGVFSQMLTWLCFGRAPALILFIFFLTAFGVSGLAIQSLVFQFKGAYLPAAGAGVPALLIAFPATRILALGYAKLLPKEDTEAVSRSQFVGKLAVILRGHAKRGLPAEAKLTDQYGQTHYLMIEPDRDGDILEAGWEVLILRQVGGSFRATRDTRLFVSKNVSDEERGNIS